MAEGGRGYLESVDTVVVWLSCKPLRKDFAFTTRFVAILKGPIYGIEAAFGSEPSVVYLITASRVEQLI